MDKTKYYRYSPQMGKWRLHRYNQYKRNMDAMSFLTEEELLEYCKKWKIDAEKKHNDNFSETLDKIPGLGKGTYVTI